MHPPASELSSPGHASELCAIILEALALTKDIRQFPDRGSPQNWAAELLARIGYVEDAENVHCQLFSRSEKAQMLKWVFQYPRNEFPGFHATPRVFGSASSRVRPRISIWPLVTAIDKVHQSAISWEIIQPL